MNRFNPDPNAARPPTPHLDAARAEALHEALDGISIVVETLAGMRKQLVEEGFSDEIAEQLVAATYLRGIQP